MLPLVVVRILILYGLVQLLVVTEKPSICAATYAAVGVLFNLMMSMPLPAVLMRGLISFAPAFVYFWLLSRTKRGSPMWYLVLPGGVVLGVLS